MREGGSVLDLVIELENEKSIIEKLKIEIRIESDHLSVQVR